jgi:cysteinyl-tRNA synthetase
MNEPSTPGLAADDPLPQPEIRLYNTLTRRVEALAPAEPGRLRMYTCGPTVYDYGHIGNFRTFVAVDVLQRFLALSGFSLDSVMNFTDVDDKMIQRAREAGKPISEYADFFSAAFEQDARVLEIRPPRHLVRATDYIGEMVAWIERLVATGHAYESGGSVYFRVGSFPSYGRLSGRPLESLQSGARVDVDSYDKEEARDFVLWKAHREGEPAWPSPWGEGRPGWHIECSVMSMKLLGESFDLHAGGTDLIFPHHENEIAQAEAITGRPFVHTWFHCEFLLVNGEKMSKSLGNFYTVRDLLQKGHRPSSIRFLLASAPYRHQLNFTFDGLRQAAASVDRLRLFRQRIQSSALAAGTQPEIETRCHEARTAFRRALADDLNTAEALAPVFELITAGNTALDGGRVLAGNRDGFLRLLEDFDAVFAVLEDSDREKMEGYGLAAGPSDAEIEALLAERARARAERDFARSDDIRRRLEGAGVVVEDVKGGAVRWRRR